MVLSWDPGRLQLIAELRTPTLYLLDTALESHSNALAFYPRTVSLGSCFM
jgi:hypothetical protein